MSAPLPGSADLNNYLDNCRAESNEAMRESKKKWDTYLNLWDGKHWEVKIPKHRIPFTANLSALSVKRKIGMITDTRINYNIHSRADSDEFETLAQETLWPCSQAIWTEQSFDLKIALNILPLAAVFGFCPVELGWNKLLDNGLGDVDLRVIDPRSWIMDPACVSAASIDDECEYLGYQMVLPLTVIQEYFTERGPLVQADSGASKFVDEDEPMSGIVSPTRPSLSQRLRERLKGTAVERAKVEVWNVKDRRRVSDLPTDMQKLCFDNGLMPEDKAFSGGRRIVRGGSNKVILYDRANPYIDAQVPFEIFDWGVNFDSPLGVSEMRDLESLQTILNKLGSQIVENAVKMSNCIWIGDRTALEPKEWDLLTDAPGLLVKKRPGSELKRESPPALPGSVFQLMQFLVNLIDVITGLQDASQGRTPRNPTSANALEALQFAQNTLVRLQARTFEAFVMRLGQKMISRIFQFYTQDRVKFLVGENGSVTRWKFERAKLLEARKLNNNKEMRLLDVFQDFRDFRWVVSPFSSLAATRQQLASQAAQLYSMGLLNGLAVLKAIGWPAPETAYNEAKAETIAGLRQPPGQSQRDKTTKRVRVPK